MAEFDWDKESLPDDGGFDWEKESLPEEGQPVRADAVTSAVRGASQGLTFGFGDEILGALEAKFGKAAPWLFKPIGEDSAAPPAEKSYEQARDQYRQLNAQSKEANPGAYMGGEFAGALASSAAIPMGKTLGGAVGAGAAYGGVGALGQSEAKDAGGMAVDVGLGAGLGMIGGAVGHGVGKGVEALSKTRPARFTQGKIDKAVADEAASQALKAQKAVSSSSGSLGGEAGAVLNIVEKAKAALTDPLATDTQREQAKRLLADPDVIRAAQRAYENILSRGTEKIGRMLSAEEALAAARQGATPEALRAATEEGLSDPLKREVWPRVRKQVIDRMVVPSIGTAAGSAIDGEFGGTGTIAGTFAGMGASALLGGRPSTAFEKMVNKPSVRKAMWETIKGVLVTAPQKLGKYAPGLMRAAQRGPHHISSEVFVLHERDPEFRDMMTKLEDEPGEN